MFLYAKCLHTINAFCAAMHDFNYADGIETHPQNPYIINFIFSKEKKSQIILNFRLVRNWNSTHFKATINSQVSQEIIYDLHLAFQ